MMRVWEASPFPLILVPFFANTVPRPVISRYSQTKTNNFLNTKKTRDPGPGPGSGGKWYSAQPDWQKKTSNNLRKWGPKKNAPGAVGDLFFSGVLWTTGIFPEIGLLCPLDVYGPSICGGHFEEVNSQNRAPVMG